MLEHGNVVQAAYDKGRDYEGRATDCCQCVIAAIQDAINCENNDILRAGSALAGGLGVHRTRDVRCIGRGGYGHRAALW